MDDDGHPAVLEPLDARESGLHAVGRKQRAESGDPRAPLTHELVGQAAFASLATGRVVEDAIILARPKFGFIRAQATLECPVTLGRVVLPAQPLCQRTGGAQQGNGGAG